MDEDIYGQFVHQMEKAGFRKVFTRLEEKDVIISDDDELIYTMVNDCQAISIKGIRESKIRGRISTKPHRFKMKVYDYNYKEARANDTVQFSIGERKRSGLPTMLPDEWSHVIYYHYPYDIASDGDGIRFKKGIVLTKDKRLEIKIIRNGSPLKIGKIEMIMECDKWWWQLRKKEAFGVVHGSLSPFGS